MQKMWIMQGLPGSGKSTRARIIALANNAVICSTDDFRIDYTGKYIHNPELNPIHHKQTQDRALYFLRKGVSVVVDNTNNTNSEARPYVMMATALGIPITFVRVQGSYENVHGVPPDKIAKMQSLTEVLSVEAALAAPPRHA